MEPTKKSLPIDSFLSAIMGKNRVEVIHSGRCMTCSGRAAEFKDQLSRREYSITGMCQNCQDAFYNGPNDEGDSSSD